MNSIVAAILAGGEGRRFRPYTDLIPKPMVPLGAEEKPLLEYIVNWLAGFGITKFVFLVGYRWRQVANYFGDGFRWGVKIDYSVDDDKYTNTGGALAKALMNGLLDGDLILVWYGDIIAPLDVKSLIRDHTSSGALATLAVADRYQVPVGVAHVGDDGFVYKLEEKPWLDIKATIGILVLDPEVLGEATSHLGRSFDIMSDLIPWMIKKGYRVKAHIYRGPWYDVGSLERYQKIPDHVIEAFSRARKA